MKNCPKSEVNSSSDDEELLLSDFNQLWEQAAGLWDCFQDTPAFQLYVSADYLALYNALKRLRGRASTFLEWGSGLGVASIMASRLGFEAYGIEAEPDLVHYSKELAETFGPKTQFAQGSFIPDQYEWSPSDGDEINRTIIDIPTAYEDLDMELRDFDLVYAYPWPNEHILYQNILRKFARNNVLFLSYDALEGTQLQSIHSDPL